MFPTYDDFINHRVKIAIIGLGYVGLPLAVCFAEEFDVIGFDINATRVQELSQNIDRTREVESEALKSIKIEYTANPEAIKDARIIIVTVPTPINNHKMPDLTPVIAASKMVGQYMNEGTVIVYESTVYPGVTEETCIPILENESGLRSGRDFKVGYSPERVNPGDKEHTVPLITKVVSAQDKQSTELLAQIYGKVIKAGIHIAPDIKTAEAAKVIENIQRDLNIALINELAIIFNKLGIDTRNVIDAAASKWNFIRFEPGMVGGHCIGVDPYYLTYKAEEIGYRPEVILAGRRINDGMGKYIAEQTVKKLIEAGKPVKNSRVLIMGITFKENIPDIRNTRVVDVFHELKEYGVIPFIFDPLADPVEVEEEYGISLIDKMESSANYDAIIVAVRHQEFTEYDIDALTRMMKDTPVLIDVKGIYDRELAGNADMVYWRL